MGRKLTTEDEAYNRLVDTVNTQDEQIERCLELRNRAARAINELYPGIDERGEEKILITKKRLKNLERRARRPRGEKIPT